MPLDKEARHQDVEANRPPRLLPTLPLLRRKKAYLFLLLLPLTLLILILTDTVASPFALSFSRDRTALWNGSDPANSSSSPISIGSTASTPLDPTPPPASNISFLDTFPLDRTPTLSALKQRLLPLFPPQPGARPPSASVPPPRYPFTLHAESLLLLLQALQQPAYLLPAAWRDTFLLRTKTSGIFGALGGGPQNSFTELLQHVGFGPADASEAASAARANALSVYRLSRADWVHTLRGSHALTLFSKSYCPYSRRAKEVLHALGARVVVYEVDQRQDGKALQEALRELAGWSTFPTVLVRDVLVGGSDEVVALNEMGALRGVLESVGAV